MGICQMERHRTAFDNLLVPKTKETFEKRFWCDDLQLERHLVMSSYRFQNKPIGWGWDFSLCNPRWLDWFLGVTTTFHVWRRCRCRSLQLPKQYECADNPSISIYPFYINEGNRKARAKNGFIRNENDVLIYYISKTSASFRLTPIQNPPNRFDSRFVHNKWKHLRLALPQHHTQYTVFGMVRNIYYLFLGIDTLRSLAYFPSKSSSHLNDLCAEKVFPIYKRERETERVTLSQTENIALPDDKKLITGQWWCDLCIT